MSGGLGPLLGGVVLQLFALAIGVLIGRYFWPRRRHPQGTVPTPPVPKPRSPADEARATGVAPAGTVDRRVWASPSPAVSAAPMASGAPPTETPAAMAGPDAGAGLDAGTGLDALAGPDADADSQSRVAYAQAHAAYAQARLAQAQARTTQLEARLNELQSTLNGTRRQFRQANAELEQMRLRSRELEDRKEAELGLLESRAIVALDSTIASHQERIAELEERLQAAETTAAESVQTLDVERRRSAQLQFALAEQHQQLARLTGEQKRQERSAIADRDIGG